MKKIEINKVIKYLEKRLKRYENKLTPENRVKYVSYEITAISGKIEELEVLIKHFKKMMKKEMTDNEEE